MVASASACAEEQESLIVRRVIDWPEDGACLADPQSETSSSRGVLDVYHGTAYLLPLDVANQGQPRDPEDSNQGVDTSEMRLRDVIVTLSMPQAPEVIEALRAEDPALVEFSAIIPSDSLPGGSSSAVFAEVVSSQATISLAEHLSTFAAGTTLTLVVEVVVRAERSGNTTGQVGIVESRAYTYPILLCSRCLFTCAPCENGLCPEDLPPDPPLTGFTCGNAQDEPLYPAVCGE